MFGERFIVLEDLEGGFAGSRGIYWKDSLEVKSLPHGAGSVEGADEEVVGERDGF